MEPSRQHAVNEASPAGWVDQHGDFLYRYALLRVGRPEAAEDLVQETFLAALRGRAQFRGDASERTWLVGILKHKVIDHLSSARRERPLSSLGDDSWEDELFDRKGHWKKGPGKWTSPGAALESAELEKVLSGCLSKLPGRLAEAFTLSEMDEMSSAEVCKVLAVSAGNLWVMLHRARLRLCACLETSWFGNRGERS
jgi:RNA polymerase sigma-70 factor (ECF subfamily)